MQCTNMRYHVLQPNCIALVRWGTIQDEWLCSTVKHVAYIAVISVLIHVLLQRQCKWALIFQTDTVNL